MLRSRLACMQIASPSLSAAAAPLLIVILVGVPGSGKSTFSRALMAGSPQPPLGRSWRRVSQDLLGSRKKCIAAAERALSIGMNVVIDRCNFDEEQRAHWLQLEGQQKPDLRLAVYLPVQRAEARRRVLARGLHEGGVDALSMSEQKIASIIARMDDELRLPLAAEGFDEVLTVEPAGAQDAGEEHAAALARIWAAARVPASAPCITLSSEESPFVPSLAGSASTKAPSLASPAPPADDSTPESNPGLSEIS